MAERFIKLFEDEVYYLVDTEGLKTLQDFIDKITQEYINEGYSYDIIKEVAQEEYQEYLYEHSMSASENVDTLNGLYNENEQLKQQLRIFEDGLKSEIKETKLAMEDWNECRTDCKKLKEENEQLKNENQRMTDKLNKLALEFLNYEIVTMGKATEISEMCYHDFLKYRKENGNPMELQL